VSLSGALVTFHRFFLALLRAFDCRLPPFSASACQRRVSDLVHHPMHRFRHARERASPAMGARRWRRAHVADGAAGPGGDVLGTIALARAGAGLAQTYQFAVARELARESSSRSWRTNAARPAAFRCSIPAGSYRPQRSRSSWRSWSRKPAAPTFADLI
jgi:hypothetical protein